tara:strand:+ start:1372 stop:3570 length:2199 start_codon:yes stop_codon:yes gene_type:complete
MNHHEVIKQLYIMSTTLIKQLDVIHADRIVTILALLFLLFGKSEIIIAQKLPLPPRATDALSGSELKTQIENLSVEDREEEIFNQILDGNVPNFLRDLIPISYSKTIGDSVYNVTYYVLPDYLALGSDSNYFLMPMTPILAQKISGSLDYTLPTKQMVDQIWSNASVKLSPSPITASPQMTTIPIMWDHNVTVKAQRAEKITEDPLGALVAGHKKDVIISNRIYGNSSKRVVIYGWHYQNGNPIQPVYAGHAETYADYSHGIRLVRDSVLINNKTHRISKILINSELSSLFSDEGIIQRPYYPLDENPELEQPKNIGVISKDSTTAQIIIKEDTDVSSYKIFVSIDGNSFSESENFTTNTFELSGLPPSQINYVKLQSISETKESIYSEVLAVVPSQTQNKILIVNGFDRVTSGNTFDFIKEHGQALFSSGYGFDSASNEAVSSNLVSLDDYEVVHWILGTESTADETFSSVEQEIVKSYLQNGGSLMVSGAEIAWDLDNKGSSSDKAFLNDYLKASYRMDSPDNKASTYYSTQPAIGSIFEGISSISYDNGTKGSYDVQYPDVLTATNGGESTLTYSGVTTQQVAGVQFKGVFPNGNTPGKMVYLGFPFETIYPESARIEVMKRIMDFMESEATSTSENEDLLVKEFDLKQNYPNPFNPTTQIDYALSSPSHVSLSVYNSVGQNVAMLENSFKSMGSHSTTWDAHTFSSGMYFYRLTTTEGSITRKMMLVK